MIKQYEVLILIIGDEKNILINSTIKGSQLNEKVIFITNINNQT
jgi:hypothetical protein